MGARSVGALGAGGAGDCGAGDGRRLGMMDLDRLRARSSCLVSRRTCGPACAARLADGCRRVASARQGSGIGVNPGEVAASVLAKCRRMVNRQC